MSWTVQGWFIGCSIPDFRSYLPVDVYILRSDAPVFDLYDIMIVTTVSAWNWCYIWITNKIKLHLEAKNKTNHQFYNFIVPVHIRLPLRHITVPSATTQYSNCWLLFSVYWWHQCRYSDWCIGIQDHHFHALHLASMFRSQWLGLSDITFAPPSPTPAPHPT